MTPTSIEWGIYMTFDYTRPTAGFELQNLWEYGLR